jgi:hypothetical protein
MEVVHLYDPSHGSSSHLGCVHPTICPCLHVTSLLSSNPNNSARVTNVTPLLSSNPNNSAKVTNCSVKHASCRKESKHFCSLYLSLIEIVGLSMSLFGV